MPAVLSCVFMSFVLFVRLELNVGLGLFLLFSLIKIIIVILISITVKKGEKEGLFIYSFVVSYSPNPKG